MITVDRTFEAVFNDYLLAGVWEAQCTVTLRFLWSLDRVTATVGSQINEVVFDRVHDDPGDPA